MNGDSNDTTVAEIKQKLNPFEEFFTVNGLKELFDAIINIPKNHTITHNEYTRFKELEKAKVLIFDIDFVDPEISRQIEIRKDDNLNYDLDDLIEISEELKKTVKAKLDCIAEKKELAQEASNLKPLNNKIEKYKKYEKLNLENLKSLFDEFSFSLENLLNEWPINHFINFLHEFTETQTKDLQQLKESLQIIIKKPALLSPGELARFEAVSSRLCRIIHKNSQLELDCEALRAQLKFMEKFDITFPESIDSHSVLSNEAVDEILTRYSTSQADSIVSEFTDLYNNLQRSCSEKVDYYANLALGVLERTVEANLEEIFKSVEMYFDFFENTVKNVVKFSNLTIQIIDSKLKTCDQVESEGILIVGEKEIGGEVKRKGNSLAVEKFDGTAVMDVVKKTCDIERRNKLRLRRSELDEKINCIMSIIDSKLKDFL